MPLWYGLTFAIAFSTAVWALLLYTGYHALQDHRRGGCGGDGGSCEGGRVP